MKAVITVQMDNAAFENENDTNGAELGRILRDLADKVENGGTLSLYAGEGINLRDANGNAVGQLEVSE